MTRINDLSITQLERLQRHLGLQGFGPEAQERLLNANVLVIGAGGLGAPVLQYLAAAGVGRLEIVDDDVVDRSNLHRQVIHSEADLGRPKTLSAAETVRGLNPEAEVVEHRTKITRENALELVRGADLVIDGSDNFLTRYIVSDAAEILGKPVVYGAILRFEGQVSVFWSGRGPTYRDLFPEPPAPGEVPSCAEAGVIGVLPGVIGTLMATEAVKLLASIGTTLLGRVLFYDALAASFRELRLAPDPRRPQVTEVAPDLADRDDAALCAVDPAGTAADAAGAGEPGAAAEDEISPEQLRGRLESGRSLRLVDVREPWENTLGAIPGARNVPLGSIQDDDGRALAADLEAGEPVVLYCKAGVRSRTAMEILTRARPDVEFRSLSGGYDAWAASASRGSVNRIDT